ncbi:response regulator transcription factor [Emticicia sp. BO119]|uniref:response regulator transcription factor n=1 Tax=Emticicia sp. BO119 TaxID=2757768 RepID=UPI0015F0F648|nr:LuxR C-terminal-related transcriptional regulator [Emticicia sp. BO119]MBA4850280.1 hypothetical protein [Emticicia sp. BO119]
MKKKTAITFLEYLDKIENPDLEKYNYSEEIREVVSAEKFLKNFSIAVFVADFQTGTYPFIGEGVEEVMGHPLGAFLEGGLKFTDYILEVPAEIDNKCLNQQIILFDSLKGKKMPDIRFKMTIPITDKKKKKRFYCQQYKIIRRESDYFPLGFYGFVTKVPDTGEEKVTQQIELLNSEKNQWEVSSNLEFYLNVDENKLLSKREIEILKWISEGLNSEQIATKLYISVHTVKTHRKNMLRRTNSSNSADLIRYGIEHKLL